MNVDLKHYVLNQKKFTAEFIIEMFSDVDLDEFFNKTYYLSAKHELILNSGAIEAFGTYLPIETILNKYSTSLDDEILIAIDKFCLRQMLFNHECGIKKIDISDTMIKNMGRMKMLELKNM